MRPALEILVSGIAATLQDTGREGYQRFGVPVSGALDRTSLAAANLLVGNAPDEAAIEVLASGLSLTVCTDSVCLAAAGMTAPFVVETAQASVKSPILQSVIARRGDVVRFPAPKGGAGFYIAAAGGFDVPVVFGSKSTYRRASLGGFEGRALQTGDRLPLRFPNAPFRNVVSLDLRLSAPECLRIIRGPNAEYFTASAFETLLSSSYRISAASDRMGLRLQGPRLERAIEGELPSQGTTEGGLQVPPDGQPILLMAERQTTGGYPRIATVIGADFAAAGRLQAGMSIRFQEVNRDEALRLLQAEREWLASLPAALKPALDLFSPERLLTANLIGGVTAGSAEE